MQYWLLCWKYILHFNSWIWRDAIKCPVCAWIASFWCNLRSSNDIELLPFLSPFREIVIQIVSELKNDHDCFQCISHAILYWLERSANFNRHPNKTKLPYFIIKTMRAVTEAAYVVFTKAKRLLCADFAPSRMDGERIPDAVSPNKSCASAAASTHSHAFV